MGYCDLTACALLPNLSEHDVSCKLHSPANFGDFTLTFTSEAGPLTAPPSVPASITTGTLAVEVVDGMLKSWGSAWLDRSVPPPIVLLCALLLAGTLLDKVPWLRADPPAVKLFFESVSGVRYGEHVFGALKPSLAIGSPWHPSSDVRPTGFPYTLQPSESVTLRVEMEGQSGGGVALFGILDVTALVRHSGTEPVIVSIALYMDYTLEVSVVMLNGAGW